MTTSADDSIRDALTEMDRDAAHSGTPSAYIRAIRTGAPGTRHRVTVNGVPVHITIRAPCPRSAHRAAASAASFAQLCAAMAMVDHVDGIQPELPAELAMAAWRKDGHDLRICRPGAAPSLRRARLRRRLTALSPVPLLAALVQPVAGGAVASLAFVPFPPIHTAAPPAPVVRELTGDIARPALPWLPGDHVQAPLSPLLPQPETAPTAPDAVPAASPSPTHTPATEGTPTPSPTVTAPQTTPSPEPTPTASTSPTESAEPTEPPAAEPTPTHHASSPAGHRRHHAHPRGRHHGQHPHGRGPRH